MAEEKGLFGLFKKKPAESAPVVELVREVVLDALPDMVPPIVEVLEGRLLVQLFMSSGTFSSHFEWEVLENDDREEAKSKCYLEEGRYLLLAPLEPPIGNLKIRSAGEIRLEFASRSYLLGCVTTLVQVTPARKICLAFPKTLRQKRERRAMVRAQVERSLAVVLSVVRPSGIVFEAKFHNISSKGAAFYGTGAVPNIADHSQVGLTIVYPEGKVETDATVLGSYPKEGEQMFRVLFAAPTPQRAQELGQLVSHVQKSNTERRSKLLR
ncbi:MAG: PilZ domain-containing protein [Magnetococcales bacterium]|nr:PilZ domain-containing protein [Magnetococcales bacterium]